MGRTLLVGARVLLFPAWIYGRRGVVRSKNQVAKDIDDFLPGGAMTATGTSSRAYASGILIWIGFVRIVSTRPPINWPCEHCLRSYVRVLPNKRLKLAGGDRFKGSGVLCPWRGTDCRPTPLRRRACRPQLKRDPLGGRHMPESHTSRSHRVIRTAGRLVVVGLAFAAAGCESGLDVRDVLGSYRA